jgi:hypothetical protein
MAALAPQLQGEARQQALAEGLAAARAIKSEWGRAEALAALAPQLEADLLAEGLAAARAIGDERYGTQALSALVPHVEGELLNRVRAALAQCLWDSRSRERRDLLRSLTRDNSSFLRAFDLPPEAYVRIAQSVIDICTEWEWL